MKSPSSITKFSGCTKNAAPIPVEVWVVIEDLTAITGMRSAALPAAPDRAASFTTKGAQDQDRRIDVTTAAARIILDLNGVGPAALRPTVDPRTVAPTIGRVLRDRHNALAR